MPASDSHLRFHKQGETEMETENNVAALTASTAQKTLLIDPGGKGGVGKSQLMALLADCLERAGRKVKIYDAESVNSKTKRMFGDAAEHYSIQDEKQQAKFLESLEVDVDVLLHDTGASYNLDTHIGNVIGGGQGALSRLFGIINDMGWTITLPHILTHNPETTMNIGRWLDRLQEANIQNVQHVVCLNKFFVDTPADCPVWVGYEDLVTKEKKGGNTRARIIELVEKGKAAMVHIPKLHAVPSAKLEVYPMRYSQAMENKHIPFAERVQIKAFFDGAYEGLSEAGPLLGFPEVPKQEAA